MTRAAIWDMDGTLVDTAELHFQAWCQLARELDKPFTRGDFAATFGMRNPEIIPRIFGTHYSEKQIEELGGRKENLYREQARHGVELLPGVQSLLEDLRAAGFKQGVGSSAPRSNLELILELTGTISFFSAIIGMEDTTRGKPDPQVFLRVAEGLQVAPAKCVVLEDAPAGVQAAKAGGMRCVAVTFVGHHSVPSLLQAGADLVVPSIDEVTVAAIDALFAGTPI